MSDRFAEYQISASEALRAGGRPGLTPEERIAFFQEAQNWAGKAFLEAKENTYDRYLAICQYTCAAGEVLLVMSGYESVMLSGEPLTQPSIPITRRNGDASGSLRSVCCSSGPDPCWTGHMEHAQVEHQHMGPFLRSWRSSPCGERTHVDHHCFCRAHIVRRKTLALFGPVAYNCLREAEWPKTHYSGETMKKLLIAGLLSAGMALGLAGVANADADDLTNVEVLAGAPEAGSGFSFSPGTLARYEPSGGGQGAFTFFESYQEPVLDENGDPVLDDDGNPVTVTKTRFKGYDDGLSDSSRDMLDKINAARAAEEAEEPVAP